jgi:hypothetical protein
VDGGGTKPTLTDEEREAIVACANYVIEASDFMRMHNHAHTLRSLLERMK